MKANLFFVPQEGGTYDAADYLDPQRAAFFEAGPEALVGPLIAVAAASRIRSRQTKIDQEYAATLARLCNTRMAVFSLLKERWVEKNRHFVIFTSFGTEVLPYCFQHLKTYRTI